MRIQKLFAVNTLFLLSGTLCSVQGQIAWDGTGDGTSWTDPSNWVGNSLPGGGDTVNMEGSNYTVTYNGNETIAAMDLKSTGDVTLNVDGGVLTLGSLIIGNGFTASSGTKRINVSGGAVNASGGSWQHLGGDSSTGILDISGSGSVSWGGWGPLGLGANAEGQLIVRDSGTFSDHTFYINSASDGDSTVTVQDDGAILNTHLYMENGAAGAVNNVNLSGNGLMSLSDFTFIANGAEDTINWTGGTLFVQNGAIVDEWGTAAFEVGTDSTLNLGDGATHLFTDGLTVTTDGTLGTGKNSATQATIDNSGGTADFTLQNGATIDYSINGNDNSSDTLLFTSNLLADFGTAPTTLNLLVDVVAGDVKQTAGPFAIFDFGGAVPTGWDIIDWTITTAPGTRLSSEGSFIVGDGLNGLAVGQIGLSGFEAFAIPEPSTAMLLGMGAMVMLLRRRIRR